MATRKKAPKVDIRNMRRTDRRTEMLEELDKKHPQYKHVWRDAETSQDDMDLWGYEWVRKDTYDTESNDSDRLGWRRDYVARIPKEVYDEMGEVECEESYEMVKSMYCQGTGTDELGRTVGNEDASKNSPGRKFAEPKDPSEIENLGGR